jgi:hypothetical protein
VPIGPEQQARLHQARLRGLLRGRWPEADPQLGAYPGGATALDDGTGWVLATEAGPRAGGGALTWAVARGCRELHLLVEEHAGRLARVLGLASLPATVWRIDGTELRDVAAEPAPAAAPVVGPPVDEVGAPGAELARLRDAGLDLLVEDGELRVEVLGLEVGRYVLGPDGELRLESGIGRFDREVSAMMHADVPPVDAVLAAAELVRSHRRRGAPPHPLRDLGRERWVRRTLLGDPGLVGADRLTPIGTTLPRPNLRDPWPALAFGPGPDGPVVAACTVGIDLDAPLLAADTRAVVAPGATLAVVTVEPLPGPVSAVVHLVRPSAEVVVEAPWAGGGPAGVAPRGR